MSPSSQGGWVRRSSGWPGSCFSHSSSPSSSTESRWGIPRTRPGNSPARRPSCPTFQPEASTGLGKGEPRVSGRQTLREELLCHTTVTCWPCRGKGVRAGASP